MPNGIVKEPEDRGHCSRSLFYAAFTRLSDERRRSRSPQSPKIRVEGRMKLDSKKYALWLWGLLGLFVLRVIGQLLVSLNLAPYLPPMNEWQSGLLPYPVLVTCQFAIIILYLKICFDFTYGEGFFVAPKKILMEPLLIFASIYFVSMPVRYVIYRSLHAETSWFSGTIPIVLHMVLATFLLLVSRYQCRQALSFSASGRQF